MHVLTTGVGSPEPDNFVSWADKVEHRYSIYEFDNYDDGYINHMFESTKHNLEFTYDERYGLPMPYRRALPRYKYPMYKKISADGKKTLRYLWSNQTLEYIPNLVRAISNFSRRAGHKRNVEETFGLLSNRLTALTTRNSSMSKNLKKAVLKLPERDMLFPRKPD